MCLGPKMLFAFFLTFCLGYYLTCLFYQFGLNAFLHKNCISLTLSPWTIITGLKLDFTKHCHSLFGVYAQVYQENMPHNSTNMAQTISALVLDPTGNIQGTYKFYNLDTGWQILADFQSQMKSSPMFVTLPMSRVFLLTIFSLSQR